MGVSLRYVDRSVRDTPWWRHHTERWVYPDPPMMPVFRLWRYWPTRRRAR